MALPYIQLPSLPLPFGLEIHIFGVLAALGIWTAAKLAARASRDYSPGDDYPLVQVAPWAVAGGLVGGRLLHVFGYHPEELAQHGLSAVIGTKGGLSSMGGVLGGLLAAMIWFKVKRIPLGKYWDAFALGMAPGWAVARIGCFFAHDHPGKRTDFFLAVAYPGGARHDLGLYDFLVLATLAIILWTVAKKPRPRGFLMGLLAIGYSVCRFFLDFLRASDLSYVDKRYLGLTPAQYVVMVLFACGVVLVSRGLLGKVPLATAEPPEPSKAAAR